MTFPITKTADHNVSVGSLVSVTSGGEHVFPTYLVTSDATSIGAANALYVQPGTGATWAISAASLPLPSGAATSAKQDSQTTLLTALAGAVSGTEVQVDVLTMPTVNVAQSGSWSVAVSSSALPTGASSAANQATIIAALSSIDGHVDGVEGALTSIDAKITAVNTGAVVVASSALPTGAATAARQDSQTTLLTTLAGAVSGTEVQVDVLTMPTVTIQDGGGSITVDGSVSVSGSVAVTDNSGSLTVDAPVGTPVFVRLSDGTSAIATLPVSVAAAVAVTDNSGSLTVDDGGSSLTVDGSVSISGSVAVTDGSGSLTVDDGGSSLTVDGTVAATQSGTWTVGLSSGTNGIGKLTANSGVTIGAVEIAAAQTLATVTTVSTVTTLTTLTGGGVAHDGVDSGNPVKIGFKASSSLAGATMVASGDRVDAVAGIDGAQIVRPHCGLEDIVSGVAAITDGSSTSVIAAQGSGVKVYITTIAISNSSATAVTVDIRDGAAGTVKLTLPVPANTAGVVLPLPVPLPFSANTAVCADPSASASTVTVTLIGFKSKV